MRAAGGPAGAPGRVRARLRRRHAPGRQARPSAAAAASFTSLNVSHRQTRSARLAVVAALCIALSSSAPAFARSGLAASNATPEALAAAAALEVRP